MSFDSHSLDRLRELGRQLPQRLPDPEPQGVVKPSQRRHKVETEQDPEVLFRELMKVSEDGSVPEHLDTIRITINVCFEVTYVFH